MRNETFTCNECGVTRKQSNHWWLIIPVFATAGGIIPGEAFSGRDLARQSSKVQIAEVRIRPWDDELAKHDDVLHLCGHQCSHTVLSRWYTTRKLTAEKDNA